MRVAIFDHIREEFQHWQSLRLSERYLGKYVILLASVLHVSWAMLIVSSEVASHSTPIFILTHIFGGRYRTAVVLVTVATLAMVGLRQRAWGAITTPGMVWLLMPQELLLFMSAIGAAQAIVLQHYADGTMRPWPFVLGDQLPIILWAMLYTIVLLESAVEA